MKVIIRPFRSADTKVVIQLWKDCGLVVPDNDPLKDIKRKKKEHPELFLVALKGKEIVGVLMGGYDGHRGAVNYFAVAPAHQRQGIGRLLMGAVEKKLNRLGCPKINLYVRVSNEPVRVFYEKLGYAQNTAGISFGKRLVLDDPASCG
jgi:ribosomal protein S18 acetylase RimI-like enzyme